ncbi:LysE family transporter [Paenibacillus arenosi]|uniref:LysE family transporter n=1 Tax=Paenibacillus arenosi TaxID=2774142 RepID=A0ABR9AV77_9BACL|nr:LysE family transporter [Paenibacillus arenosi]MBD8498031.1 LysE family transporter [Paenibacillus arenosi]
MNAFLTYVFLGISLSAPIGPVNAAQLERGAKYGFLHAWLVGLGAMVADLIFMLLIYFGVAHFLTTPFMQTFLWSFGFFVLMYTGIETLMNVKQQQHALQYRSAEPASKSFLSGFLMAIASPLSILFWLGIYGAVLAKTVESQGVGHILFYSAGIFVGILLWDFIMAGFASTLYRYGSSLVLQIISLLSGLSLIGFGIYFGIEAIMSIFG